MLNEKIFVAGHKGLVGSSVIRILKKKKYFNVITRTRKQLDLFCKKKILKFLKKEKIRKIIICAAKVGGIKENYKKPADFFYENSLIQNNLIHSAFQCNIKDLIFLGSSCIYPKFSKQPIKEKELLTGQLEDTNRAYAVAKISGVEMCRSYNVQYNTNYKCLMPSNLFGPNDNYDLYSSHFFAACVRKIYEAKVNNKDYVNFLGTGKSRREALFVDDLADAIVFFLNKKTNHYLINIGSNYENSIKNYVKIISKIFNYNGKIIFDNNKFLDGTPRKKVCTQLAKGYGWKPSCDFNESMEITIEDFKKNYNKYIKS